MGKGLSITALVLGILSLVFGIIPLIGLLLGVPIGIAAIVCGIVALVKKTDGRGMAITGLVMGAIALLILPLIMIGAIAYFGVLNPSEFVPDTCIFASQFTCEGSEVSTSTLNVAFRNNVDPVTISSVSVSSFMGETVVVEPNEELNMGEVFNLEVDISEFGLNSGDKEKFEIDLEYFTSGSTLTRNAQGEVVATVQ